jgi:hypothetical protein
VKPHEPPRAIDADDERIVRSIPVHAPPPVLKQRVLAAVTTRRTPTRQAHRRQTLLITTSSWLLSLAVFVYAGGVRVTGRPLSLVLVTAAGFALIALVTACVALGRGTSTLGRARRWLVPIVVASPAALLAWKIAWSAQYEGAMAEWPTRPGLRCLVLSLALGVSPLLAFAVARRQSDPRRPVLTGFAAGIAIGALTELLTDLWCPVAFIPHLLLGHLLPMLILGLLGAALGRQVIALRGDAGKIERVR